MNTVVKTAAAFGLAALAFGTLAIAPASAQGMRPLRHHQMHRATVLDRKAAHAAITGHYRAANRLRHQATRLRTAARHGY